jgi:hypothetical protein
VAVNITTPAILAEDFRYELAQHVPSGGLYVLKFNSLWRTGDCIGWTYTACRGPVPTCLWLDQDGTPLDDWREMAQAYLESQCPQNLMIDAAWANTQQWQTLVMQP